MFGLVVARDYHTQTRKHRQGAKPFLLAMLHPDRVVGAACEERLDAKCKLTSPNGRAGLGPASTDRQPRSRVLL